MQSESFLFKPTCSKKLCDYKDTFVAVVVAQLVERLLPIPEVRGSNPVIGKN